MRVSSLLAVVALGLAADPSAQAPVKDVASVLTAAREALGGEKQLTAIRTLVATGRTQQVRGNNLVPIEFEIACEFPAKCVRKDEIPAQENGPTTLGFSGEDLIQSPEPAPAAPRGARGAPGQDADGRAARVQGVKQDFARLTLGWLASSFSAYPLTFRNAGEAESPQGKADAIDVTDPAAFVMRLFIHRDTHLPLMVSWPGPAGRGQTAPVEQRLYFADYRDVGGLRFPFRIRRGVGPDTVEETIFDRYRVNVKIDPKRFEVRR